jgi:hypothetical protein
MLNWREIPGLVSDDECETLQQLAKGKRWKGFDI